MVVLYINDTGFIGTTINGLTANVTGSLFLTLLAILLLLLVIALAFRIPTEAVAVIYLPFLLVLLAMSSEWTAIVGCALIMLGFILAKYIVPK